MRSSTIAALVLAACAAPPASAWAEDGDVVVNVKAAKACNPKTAAPADLGEVAYSPDAFAGRCLSLQGYWRDVAVYPSRAEAAQPDALSIPFLDRRRIGLYLPDKGAPAAPSVPQPVHMIGVVGSCAMLRASDAEVSGYCHYKTGAYLAVARISLDR